MYQVRLLDDLIMERIEEFEGYVSAESYAKSLAEKKDDPVGLWDDTLKGNQLVAIAYAGDLYKN